MRYDMNINELRKVGTDRLTDAGIRDAAIDAALLLEHVLSVRKDYLLAHGDEQAEESKSSEYLEYIDRRCKHIPLQQLTGHQEFMGLDFKVSEAVLIPRQDTECLVEEAMIEIGDGMKVLDLCTGSGCIIISLAKYKNDLLAVGTDISEEALVIAEGNADLNGVEVSFIRGDLYDGLHKTESKENGIPERYDAIVSNPPYIATSVIDTLMEEVREHEPLMALDGGEDGLIFYRRIIDGADGHLMPGGVILFEIGYDQGRAVSELLEDKGYRDIQVIKDLAGLDRVVKAHRPLM